MSHPRTRPHVRAVALGAILALLLTLAALATGGASSHREAPLISEDPVADTTDVYAFTDPSAPGMVNLIANWIPLEEPASGPNFHSFGDDVLYTIDVDNDHDAVADIVYEFRFRTLTRNPATFLYNTGPIESNDAETWNRPQLYTVTRVVDGERTELGTDLTTPPVNIGPRSTPDYESLANDAVHTLGTTKVFAGQRDEAFPVDLGSVFDLLGLRPLNEAHAIQVSDGDDTAPGLDTTSGYNVHTVALQVPASELVGPDSEDIIAVWSETYRRKTRVFVGNDGASLQHSGPWVQVSRLGMPLVNEVVIPLQDKDVFNASQPQDDGQFLSYVQYPEIDDLVRILYPPFQAEEQCYPDKNDAIGTTDDAARDDLVAIFLTGVGAFGNQPTDGTPYEAIRLNVTSEQSSFPNGRHPEDDVVDIALRAVAGAFGACAGESPNQDLTDGVAVQQGEAPIMDGFPFLPTPHQGYDHVHDHGSAE